MAAFSHTLVFGMEGVMAMLSDQTIYESSTNDNELIYKKVCNKFISIFEKNFALETQPRMLINFKSQYDIWYVAPKGFNKDKFTTHDIINSVENELGTVPIRLTHTPTRDRLGA